MICFVRRILFDERSHVCSISDNKELALMLKTLLKRRLFKLANYKFCFSY